MILKRSCLYTKIVSLLVSFAFMASTLTFADGISSISPAKNSKLAPELFLSGEEHTLPLETALICSAIEKKSAGNRDEIRLEDLRKWALCNPSQSAPENFKFFVYGGEIHILTGNKYLIRYFDPSKPSLGLLFPRENTGSLVSEVELSPKLKRQIYKTSLALPSAFSPEGIFRHILRKAGLSDTVKLEVGAFPASKEQYPICELQPDGTLVIHPEFLLDFEDLRSSGVGFDFTFPDGEMRWIDLADSIAYRAAMHEFKLPGREGHGHGYLDDGGKFSILHDDERTNTVGRRYSLVDDAMWLWYLHSYKINDKLRYDNKALRRQLVWIFRSSDKRAVKARTEFPGLVKDRKKREAAIELALMINDSFFRQRKEMGIDTTPAYERPDALLYGKERPSVPGSARATEGAASRGASGSAAGDEFLEIPYIAYYDRPERELNERNAEERAAVELQHEVSVTRSELDVLIADARDANTDDERAAVHGAETRLVTRLRDLYRDIPVDIPGGRTHRAYSNTLKEYRKRSARAYREMEKADREGNKEALRLLNLELIKDNKIIMKLQVLLAGMALGGRTRHPHPGLRRGTAREALTGARSSAKALEEELGYRIKRLRSAGKIRELETTDWGGDIVRTFRLEGFDIRVTAPEEDGTGARVVMRQQRYINVHTNLDSIRRDIKRGNIKEAIGKLDVLIALYGVRYIVAKERYKDIAADLRAIRNEVLALPEANAPPAEKMQELEEKIERLTDNIAYPKQRIWTDITYKGLAESFRSKVHTIAGYIPEYSVILKYRSDLEYYADKLGEASEKGSISKRMRGIIRKGLIRMAEWTERGFVREKVDATIDLNPALELLKKGDNRKTEEYLKQVIGQLDARLAGIERIIFHEKKRAEALYAEFRDADIKVKAGIIAEKARRGELENAMEAVKDLRELYFDGHLVEPGYIRAEITLRKVSGMLRGAANASDPAPAVARLEEVLKQLAEDITHKNSFRVSVLEENGTAREIFINPGTTAAGILSMLGKNSSSVWVSIGYGWLGRRELDVRIRDGAHVRISKPARATGEGGYRGAMAGEGISGIKTALQAAMPYLNGKVDISRLGSTLEKMIELAQPDDHKEMLEAFLGLLENSPPEELAEAVLLDRFGFEQSKETLDMITGDPVLLFDQMGRYFIKYGLLSVKLTSGGNLRVEMKSPEEKEKASTIGGADIAADPKLFEGEKWWDPQLFSVKAEGYKRKEDYYYFRVFIKALFSASAPDSVAKALEENAREVFVYRWVYLKDESTPGVFRYEDMRGEADRRTEYYLNGMKAGEMDGIEGLVAVHVTANGNRSVDGYVLTEHRDLADKYILVEVLNGERTRVLEGVEEGVDSLRIAHEYTKRKVYVYDGARIIKDNDGKWSHDGKKENMEVVAYLRTGRVARMEEGVIRAKVNGGGYLTLDNTMIFEGRKELAGKYALVEVRGGKMVNVYIENEEFSEDISALVPKVNKPRENAQAAPDAGRSASDKVPSETKDAKKAKPAKGMNNILWTKGRVFEEIIWEVYNTLYGKHLEFEKAFISSGFIQEYRYPDFYVKGEVLADAKWGLNPDDIVSTILKYSRLKLMLGLGEKLTIIVCDETERSNVEKEIERMGEKGVRIDGNSYSIITADRFIGRARDALKENPQKQGTTGGNASLAAFDKAKGMLDCVRALVRLNEEIESSLKKGCDLSGPDEVNAFADSLSGFQAEIGGAKRVFSPGILDVLDDIEIRLLDVAGSVKDMPELYEIASNEILKKELAQEKRKILRNLFVIRRKVRDALKSVWDDLKAERRSLSGAERPSQDKEKGVKLSDEVSWQAGLVGYAEKNPEELIECLKRHAEIHRLYWGKYYSDRVGAFASYLFSKVEELNIPSDAQRRMSIALINLRKNYAGDWNEIVGEYKERESRNGRRFHHLEDQDDEVAHEEALVEHKEDAPRTGLWKKRAKEPLSLATDIPQSKTASAEKPERKEEKKSAIQEAGVIAPEAATVSSGPTVPEEHKAPLWGPAGNVANAFIDEVYYKEVGMKRIPAEEDAAPGDRRIVDGAMVGEISMLLERSGWGALVGKFVKYVRVKVTDLKMGMPIVSLGAPGEKTVSITLPDMPEGWIKKAVQNEEKDAIPSIWMKRMLNDKLEPFYSDGSMVSLNFSTKKRYIESVPYAERYRIETRASSMSREYKKSVSMFDNGQILQRMSEHKVLCSIGGSIVGLLCRESADDAELNAFFARVGKAMEDREAAGEYGLYFYSNLGKGLAAMEESLGSGRRISWEEARARTDIVEDYFAEIFTMYLQKGHKGKTLLSALDVDIRPDEEKLVEEALKQFSRVLTGGREVSHENTPAPAAPSAADDAGITIKPAPEAGLSEAIEKDFDSIRSKNGWGGLIPYDHDKKLYAGQGNSAEGLVRGEHLNKVAFLMEKAGLGCVVRDDLSYARISCDGHVEMPPVKVAFVQEYADQEKTKLRFLVRLFLEDFAAAERDDGNIPISIIGPGGQEFRAGSLNDAKDEFVCYWILGRIGRAIADVIDIKRGSGDEKAYILMAKGADLCSKRFGVPIGTEHFEHFMATMLPLYFQKWEKLPIKEITPMEREFFSAIIRYLQSEKEKKGDALAVSIGNIDTSKKDQKDNLEWLGASFMSNASKGELRRILKKAGVAGEKNISRLADEILRIRKNPDFDRELLYAAVEKKQVTRERLLFVMAGEGHFDVLEEKRAQSMLQLENLADLPGYPLPEGSEKSSSITPAPVMLDNDSFLAGEKLDIRRVYGEPVPFNDKTLNYEPPKPGYVRIVSDEAMKELSERLKEKGLGFLADGEITYARVMAGSYDEMIYSNLPVFRVSNNETKGSGFAFYGQLILPDIKKEDIPNIYRDMTARYEKLSGQTLRLEDPEEQERFVKNIIIGKLFKQIGVLIFIAIGEKQMRGELGYGRGLAETGVKLADKRFGAQYKDAPIVASRDDLKVKNLFEMLLASYFFPEWVGKEAQISPEEKTFFDAVLAILADSRNRDGRAFALHCKDKMSLEEMNQKRMAVVSGTKDISEILSKHDNDILGLNNTKPVRATEGADYRGAGYWDAAGSGGVLPAAVNDFVSSGEGALRTILAEEKEPVLFRLPVEALAAIGDENAGNVLSALSASPNICIELFSSGGGSVANDVYTRFGIVKRQFSAPRTRENTVTMIIAGKNDDISSNAELMQRMGADTDLKPTDTILMPLGLNVEGRDLSGVMRSIVLGVRLVKLARDHKAGKVDDTFVNETLDGFRELCEDTVDAKFNLTGEDLLALAAGNINRVITSLKKLIRLLPMLPMNAEELRDIYQTGRAVILAA